MTVSKTEKAFDRWCNEPTTVQAVSMFDKSLITLVLLIARSSFMEGAKYATDRCKEEGHKP